MQTMTVMNMMLMATESPSKAARADATMVPVIEAVLIIGNSNCSIKT